MNVVIHFDEIFLKGNNQGMFVKKLADNIRRLFKGVTVLRVEGGMFLEDIAEEDLAQLALVPGIAKYAPAVSCKRDMKTVEKAVLGLPVGENINSFKILSSRSDKSFKINSDEMNRVLGTAVVKKTGLKVTLKKPDLTIHADIGRNRALIYGNLYDGAGGLPTGTAGKVICLLSGGIDSPVAAYEIMKRGAEVILVHFQNQTTVTEEVSEKIIDIAKTLARYQPEIKLVIVPFAPYQKQIVMKIPSDHRMIISRRLMFKLSELLAKKEKAQALITGDSLGQVASQTLENMNVIYESAQMLKLAPLVGTNKGDIIKQSKRIGIFEISARPYEDCCSLFVAKHPKTRAHLSAVKKMEKGIEYTGLDKITPISYHISIH